MSRNRPHLAALAAVLAALVLGPPSAAADPCTIEWDGGAGTNSWHDDANWAPNRQPGSGDEVCVGPGADVGFGAANVQVAGLRLDGSLTVAFSELQILGTRESAGAGTLTVSGGGRLRVDRELRVAALRESSGNVYGDGTVATPDFRWTGGRQQGAGSTTVVPGGPGLELAGGTHVLDQTRTLRIEAGAEAALTSGDLELDDHARVENAGLLDLRGDADLIGCCGVAPEVVNEPGGTIRKSQGSGVAQLTYAFANDGVVEVLSGTLSLEAGSIPGRPSEGVFQIAAGTELQTGGALALGPASRIAGAGLLRVAAGQTHLTGVVDAPVRLDGPAASIIVDAPVAIPRLTLARGILAGAATLSTPDLTWTGGSQIGDGATRIVPGGPGLSVEGDALHPLDGRRLEVADGATATLRGTLALLDGAVLDNAGILELPADHGISTLCCGSPPSVRNSGTLRKSGGDGRATISPELRNDGVLEARSGTLELGGGLANLDDAGSLVGGRYVVTATLALVDAAVRTNVAAIVLDGPDARIEDLTGGNGLGTLESNVGELRVAGGELATAGDLATSGTVVLGDGAALRPAGTYRQTDGVTELATTDAALVPGDRAELTGGVLRGDGTVVGSLFNAAEVDPGLGLLTVIGDYRQTGSGVLTVTVAGPDTHGQLGMTGRADLAGTLRIVTRDFEPDPSDEIELVRHTAESGEFDTVEGLEPSPGHRYSPPDYPDGAVWLRPGTVPTVSVGDAVAAERGAAAVTVAVDPVPTRSVRVDWRTLDGSAAAPADYGAAAGTLAIPHGQASGTVSVPIREDALDEPDELFGVELTGSVGATPGRSRGLVAILDDDPPAKHRPPPHRPPGGGGTPPRRPPRNPPVRWPHPQAPHRCVDRKRPTSRLRRGRRGVRRSHHRLFLRGTARDRGCSHLRRVLVSIALRTHKRWHHRCRFVKRNGRLGKRRRCARAVWIPVHGKRSWHRGTRRLRAGRYTIRTRAIDRAGNRERKPRRARPRRVRLR